MNAITAFAKAHLALIGAVGAWLSAALKDGHISTNEWYGLAIAVVTGLTVYAVPNRPGRRLRRNDAGVVATGVVALVAIILLVSLLLGFAVNHFFLFLLLLLILVFLV